MVDSLIVEKDAKWQHDNSGAKLSADAEGLKKIAVFKKFDLKNMVIPFIMDGKWYYFYYLHDIRHD